MKMWGPLFKSIKNFKMATSKALNHSGATVQVHFHDASPAWDPHHPQNKLLPYLGNHIAQAGGLDFKGPKSTGLRKQILPWPGVLTTTLRCSGPCALILQVTCTCNKGCAHLYRNLYLRVLSQPGETNGPQGCLSDGTGYRAKPHLPF